MPDGAETYALTGWLGAERFLLEDQRARLEEKLALLAEIERAHVRYAELASQEHPPPLPLGGDAPADADQDHRIDLMTPPPPAPRGECERCGAAFVPNARGGHRQLYCSKRCRSSMHKERRKPAVESEPGADPEPALLATPDAPENGFQGHACAVEPLPELADVLAPPMPVVEEPEPPAAPVRVRMDRGYNHSLIATKEPIHDDHRARQARMHDRAGDERFVAALKPMLSSEARERAEAVRVSEGDPAAQLLE